MIHKKIEIKARGMEAVGNLYTYFLDSSIEMWWSVPAAVMR